MVPSEAENKSSTLMIMMMGLCLLLFAFVAGMACSCWCSVPLKKHDENKAIEKSINKEFMTVEGLKEILRDAFDAGAMQRQSLRGILKEELVRMVEMAEKDNAVHIIIRLHRHR